MKQPLASDGLVGQQQALDAYFDALFSGASPLSAPEQAPVAEAPVAVEPPAQSRPAQVDAEHSPNSQRVQVFIVAGLTLALPVRRLQAVLNNHAEISALAKSPAPLAGTIDWNGGPLSVVDTARLILPAERSAALDADAGPRCRHLLVIDDGRWALGCTDLGEQIELKDAEITWRTAAGKRPWLAGMAAQRRCALLDVDGLLGLLEGGMA